MKRTTLALLALLAIAPSWADPVGPVQSVSQADLPAIGSTCAPPAGGTTPSVIFISRDTGDCRSCDSVSEEWQSCNSGAAAGGFEITVDCDGVDDHVEIDAAFDTAVAAGGGTVYLESGTCSVDPTAVAGGDGLSVPSDVHLSGTGRGATIIQMEAGVIASIDVLRTTTGATNVTIENLTIDGNRANRGGAPTTGTYNLAARSDRTLIRNVESLNASANGVGVPVSGVGVEFVEVWSHDNFNHQFYSGAAAADIRISGGEYSDCVNTTSGYAIQLANGPSGVKIEATRAHDCVRGININGVADGQRFIVSGSSVYDNAEQGIVFDSLATIDVVGIITDNEIYSNGDGASSFEGNGILLNQVRGVAIANNEVWENDGNGIKVLDCRDTIISTNRIWNNNQEPTEITGDGISLEQVSGANTDGCVVVGNSLYDDQVTPTQDTGLRVVAAFSGPRNTIANNVAWGNVTADITVDGSFNANYDAIGNHGYPWHLFRNEVWIGGTDPELRLSDTFSQFDYVTLSDQSTDRALLEKVVSAATGGSALLDIEAKPLDKLGDSYVNMFRQTETSGSRALRIYCSVDPADCVDVDDPCDCCTGVGAGATCEVPGDLVHEISPNANIPTSIGGEVHLTGTPNCAATVTDASGHVTCATGTLSSTRFLNGLKVFSQIPWSSASFSGAPANLFPGGDDELCGIIAAVGQSIENAGGCVWNAYTPPKLDEANAWTMVNTFGAGITLGNNSSSTVTQTWDAAALNGIITFDDTFPGFLFSHSLSVTGVVYAAGFSTDPNPTGAGHRMFILESTEDAPGMVSGDEQSFGFLVPDTGLNADYDATISPDGTVNFPTGVTAVAPMAFVGAITDNDCTGQEGGWWYDETDGRFEFCQFGDTLPSLLGTGGGGAGAANYNESFSAQTTVVLDHGMGTSNVLVACYDASELEILPDTKDVTDADNVTVTFSTAQTGRCVVNGSGGGSATRYVAAFSAQTTVNVSAATHGLATDDLIIQCYDDSTPKARVEFDDATVNGSGDVVITFAVSETGECVLM